MARTALTPTSRPLNDATAKATGTAIAGLVADGASVAISNPLPQYVIEVEHTTASEKDLTVSAGVSPPADAAGQGDLVEAFAAGDGTPVIKHTRLESSRFIQDDGTVHLDFETGMTGTIRVYHDPNAV